MLLPLVNTAQQYLFVIDGANQLVQRCRMHLEGQTNGQMLLPLVNTAQQYLFVIDGANQLVQRCRMHKLRNVVERLEIVPNLVEGGRAAVLKLGSLRESSKPFTTKENRREETISHSRFRKATASQPPRSHSPAQPKRAAHAALG